MKQGYVAAALWFSMLSQTAIASDWWLVDFTGKRPLRVITFMDKEGARKVSDARIRIWTTNYFEGNPPEPGILYTKDFQEFNCVNRTVLSLSKIQYDREDNTVRSYDFSRSTDAPRPIAPDTIAESKLKFACGESLTAIEMREFEPQKTARFVLSLLDEPSPAK